MTDLILISDGAEVMLFGVEFFAVEHEVSAEIFFADNRIFSQLLRSTLELSLIHI